MGGHSCRNFPKGLKLRRNGNLPAGHCARPQLLGSGTPVHTGGCGCLLIRSKLGKATGKRRFATAKLR
jgi:hypothetical protein